MTTTTTLTKNEQAVMATIAATFNSWRTGPGIAAELGSSPQGVQRTLASLVRKGLVEKYRFRTARNFDNDPRRSEIHVRLTAAGIARMPNYQNPLAGWWT